MRSLVLCLLLAVPATVLAQESTVPVPQKHIPPPVLLELRSDWGRRHGRDSRSPSARASSPP